MMLLLGLTPFAVSVLLACTSGALARRLSPRVAAPLLTLLALATSLATGLVLCVAAFSALARQPFIASVGGWSRTTMRPWSQLPVSWGILAAATATVLLAAALGYLTCAARGLVRARRVCRGLDVGPDRLVITSDDRPTAYTVPAYTMPARTGAIVVSTGMLRLLRADERRALLAHEAAHLRHHHASYLLVARLAAAGNPLLRPIARDVRLAVELWADQVAADEVGDSRIVAQALARASLAAAAPARRPALTLAMAQTDVSARVRALMDRPPRLYPWALAAALTLTVVSSTAALTLTWMAHQQVETAQLISAEDHVRVRPATTPPLVQAVRARCLPAGTGSVAGPTPGRGSPFCPVSRPDQPENSQTS
jgi:Zn-dependent protease with chaperone function